MSNEVFEFYPEPANTDEWWTNLQSVVSQLAQLLETRPTGKIQPTPEPASVAMQIEGTVKRSDLPRATVVAGETLFPLSDVARWLGVSRTFMSKQARRGTLTTYTPECFLGAKNPRLFVKEDDLRRFLGRAK